MKICPECDESLRFPDGQTYCDIHGMLLIKGEELEPGTIVGGKYRIERLLGHGGMGHVYLATDMLLDQRRALKLLSARVASDYTFVRRFLREARAAVRVDDPNVVRIYSLEQQTDGAFFICMEYVQGPGLRELLDKNPDGLPVDYAISLVRGIASGLRAAHGVSLVHRDIKPENILLSADSRHGSVPKIVDFGIVAWADEKNRGSVTHRPILTPQYASPEQFMGVIPAAELDGRTDLYALGVVFFEMLTGRLPFEKATGGNSTYEQWLNQHCTAQPLRPGSLRPELAEWPGLDELILNLLAKEREKRPKDAAELLALLDAVHHVSALRPARTVREDTTLHGEADKQLSAAAEDATDESENGKTAADTKPRSKMANLWTLGVFAFVVLAAGFAAWQLIAPSGPAWTDPSTGLMWAKFDNGSDVTWQQATDYCRNLHLADHSDWRLATIDELQGVYGQNGGHVNGNLQLSGWPWSSSQANSSGVALYCAFYCREQQTAYLNVASLMRALCVRRPGK